MFRQPSRPRQLQNRLVGLHELIERETRRWEGLQEEKATRERMHGLWFAHGCLLTYDSLRSREDAMDAHREQLHHTSSTGDPEAAAERHAPPSPAEGDRAPAEANR